MESSRRSSRAEDKLLSKEATNDKITQPEPDYFSYQSALDDIEHMKATGEIQNDKMTEEAPGKKLGQGQIIAEEVDEHESVTQIFENKFSKGCATKSLSLSIGRVKFLISFSAFRKKGF